MRKWRWQIAATVLHDIEPHLAWIFGVLSSIDQDLYRRDQRHKELLRMGADAKLSEWLGIGDAIALSYLWVLAAYEAIRTIDQRLAELGPAATSRRRASADLKHKFERLRIPLAKLEPSKRNLTTDYSFPRPGFEDNRGIAWEVAPGESVSRSYLSDEFLSLLEAMKSGILAE